MKKCLVLLMILSFTLTSDKVFTEPLALREVIEIKKINALKSDTRDFISKLKVFNSSDSVNRKESGLGYTPLHYAAVRGDINAAKDLLQAGAKVNALNNDGDSPLHLAAKKGYEEVIHLLIEHGANRDAENRSGHKPNEMTQDKTIIKKLNDVLIHDLSEGARHFFKENSTLKLSDSIDAQESGYHNTPLLIAIKKNNIDVIKELIKKGADTHAKPKRDESYLEVAKRLKLQDIVTLLESKN